ncbi:saccharopine dehydrogenase family protein [Halomarina pelagica]|uniref:saccharopine dehydrogenase family protein n=1 Tax=Halomarina pelagica TaxID=2961599 RepID=UPI0020C22A0B|nr:saccharopine dehydrogenase NADP-binding domain-containing protein [Halomarina sp. BND7]
MDEELLIYGSYGYTGSLIAEAAVDRGLSPVLAGRRAESLERQATTLGLDHRVFSLEHPNVVEAQVGDAAAVLNCAGPFSATATPLVEACLETGTDYLDIAGEIDVLEAVAERDREAERAGVTLLPAVGFDVVPTDCLAAFLEAELPSATRLALAIDGLETYSPGTLKSIVEGLSRPGAVREGGEVRTVPAAWKTRRIDFGEGPKPAVTVPWGDVSTAYYATGIPNVEVYATVPPFAVGGIRWTGMLAPMLGMKPVQCTLKRLVDATVSGPTAAERSRSVARVWGEVEDDEGERVAARLRTPDTYDLTARTAVESARHALDGDVSPGFQTPASAFGPDFVLGFEGVERESVRHETAGGAGGMGGEANAGD